MPPESPGLYPLGHKIIGIVTNNKKITFASAVRNQLRVMSGLNSLYFTPGDVVQQFKKDFLAAYPELAQNPPLFQFSKLVGSELKRLERTSDLGASAIIRTPTRIGHSNPDSIGTKSYGYRFGPAIGAATIDKDSIDSTKSHAEQFGNLFAGGSLIDGIKTAMKDLTFTELHTLGLYIQSRLVKKHALVSESLEKFIGERRRKLEEEGADLDRALKHR